MIRTIYILDRQANEAGILKDIQRVLDNSKQIITFWQAIDTQKEIEKFRDFPIIDKQGNLNYDALQLHLKNFIDYLPYYYYLPVYWVINGKVYSVYSLTGREIQKLIKQDKTKVYKIIEIVIEEEKQSIESLLDDLENAILEKDYSVALELLEDLREEVKRDE